MAVHQFIQTKTLGKGEWQHQPGIGHKARIIEGYVEAVGELRDSIYWVLPVRAWFSA